MRRRAAGTRGSVELRFIGPNRGELERDRSDRTVARIRRDWTTWRGRAIEPIIRESLMRLLPTNQTPWLDDEGCQHIGGYWTRSNDVEIDLVGADRHPVASHIGFIGSIKWHEHEPFDRRDLHQLAAIRPKVPGTTQTTPLIAVSRQPSDISDTDAKFHADDLNHAWQQ